MKPEFFDIHSHINFPDYDTDREQIIGNMKEEKVFSVTIGTSEKTSKEAVDLANKHENLFASVGIHPSDVKGDVDLEKISKLAKDKQVVCIGETGFDSFHSDNTDLQEKVFRQHIELAKKIDKPLMLHLRTGIGKDSVYKKALDVLSDYSGIRGNAHFFAGSKEELKNFLDIGFTVSFTGVITFVPDYDELIKYVPIDMVHAETDAPFVAPAPHRGQRNNPVYVKEIVKRIAQIKKIDLSKVRHALIQNAFDTFL